MIFHPQFLGGISQLSHILHPVRGTYFRGVSTFACILASVLASMFFQTPSMQGRTNKLVVPPPVADLDVRAYRVTLSRVAAAVQELPTHPAAISSLRASLSTSWRVTTPGGAEHAEISTAWLNSALASMQNNPANLVPIHKDILAHLKILQEQAESLDTAKTSAVNPSALPRLNAILQRSEFTSVQPPTWWQQFTARVGNWAHGALSKIFGGKGKYQAGRLVFVWSSIIALFVFLAWIMGRAVMRTARHTELALGTPAPAKKSWRAWAQEALAAAKELRFREAVHFGYWAGVYRLQDLGALKLESARTPREYLRMLYADASNLPAQAQLSTDHYATYRAPLQNLTRKLELTWYGCQPATKHDFAETIENLEALGCRFPSDQPIAGS